MYVGETQVNQDDLQEFMIAAKGLEISGLLTASSRTELYGSENDSIKTANVMQYTPIGVKENTEMVRLSDSSSTTDFLNLIDEEYVSPVKAEVKREQFPCEQCDYKAFRADHLKRHVLSIHEKGRMNCIQCDFSATRLDNL